MKEDARAVMEGPAGVGQGHPISVAVEQAQPELALQIFDRGKDRRMASPQPQRPRLEASLGHHGVETKQLMNCQTVHYLLPRQSFSEFCPIYQILPPYDRSAPDLPVVLRRRGRRKVITLYKFGPFLGTPDSSPFVIKAMMLLRLAGVPFREAQAIRSKPRKGSCRTLKTTG
jgi:hypothetical protein